MLTPRKLLPKRFLSKRVLLTLVVLILLVGSGIFLFFLARKQDLSLPFSTENTQNKSEDLIEAVGEKMILPNETPTIATVSDKSQLAGQDFFNDAENGDKVLIFPNKKIAVLYRPSLDKIINVGPVSMEGQNSLETTPGASGSAEITAQDVNVIILNGTTTVGLTQVAANDLANLEYINIEDRLDAEKKPYEETMVIVSDNAFQEQAKQIAEVVGGVVANTLPEGENASGDIVILLGKDYANASE